MTKYVDASPFELLEGRLLPSDGVQFIRLDLKSHQPSNRTPQPNTLRIRAGLDFTVNGP